MLIRLVRAAKRLNQGVNYEGVGGRRKKWNNMGIALFRGLNESTV